MRVHQTQRILMIITNLYVKSSKIQVVITTCILFMTSDVWAYTVALSYLPQDKTSRDGVLAQPRSL